MSQINEATALALALLTIAGTLATYLKKIRPARRQREAERLQRESDRVAQLHVLIGRPPVLDSITQTEIAPALPGIGVRMERQETQMAEITRAVGQLADTHIQLTRIDSTLDNHEDRIKALEDATTERVATKFESASAWNAVEAVANSTPPEQEPKPSSGA